MRLRQGFKGFWIAVLAVLLDQAAKFFVQAAGQGVNAPIVPGVLRFRYVRNFGAAFGMLQGRGVALAVLAVVVCVLAVVLLQKMRDCSRWTRVGLWLVAAGGLGNAVDRAVYGYVVDFLEFAFIDFPVFNLADVFIVCGAVSLGIGLLFADGKDKRHGGTV